MLIFSKILKGTPVGSIHAGHRVAEVVAPIIDPNTLKIVALHVLNLREPANSILLIEDIRTYERQGILINHSEDLVPPDDIVRLEKVLAIEYELIGKKVETTSGDKVGTILDYTFDPESFVIQQLHVQPGFFNALRKPDRIIHRAQITKTTDKMIIVRDTKAKKTSHLKLMPDYKLNKQLQTKAAQVDIAD